MTPRDTAMWLPSALLLLQIPCCSPLSGPSTVTGTVGGSLNVQCRYPKEYRTYNKYWCREPSPPVFCSKIVQTQVSERRRRGRVSIRDHPVNLTFTVTLKDLTPEDAGSYWCGIDSPWYEGWDDHFEVMVTVHPNPALTTASSPGRATSTLGPPMSPSEPSWPSTTREAISSPSPHSWSLFSSVRFLLLVFLEVPLLLSMLSAVIWVNRPQRNSGRRRQSD